MSITRITLSRPTRHSQRLLLPVGLATLSLALAGCGGDGENGGNGAASGDAKGDTAAVSAAQEVVTKYSEVPSATTDLEPFTPTSDPMTIGISGCGANIPSCKKLSDTAIEAVEALGWKPVFYDGTQSQSGWIAGMSSLIGQDVDGIVKFVQPDSFMPNSMKEAEAAGIPVVCGVCGNAGEDQGANPSLVSVDVDYREQGRVAAAWVIQQTNGTAKTVSIDNKLATPVRLRTEGYNEVIENCSTCELVDSLEVAQDADILEHIRTTVTSLLATNPEGTLDYIEMPTDAYFDAFNQPLESANRTDVKIIGYDGSDAGLNSVRTGGTVEATVDSPLGWLAYAAVDQIARELSGQPVTENVSIPFRLIHKDNIPAEGEEAGGVDYPAIYEKLWGL